MHVQMIEDRNYFSASSHGATMTTSNPTAEIIGGPERFLEAELSQPELVIVQQVMMKTMKKLILQAIILELLLHLLELQLLNHHQVVKMAHHLNPIAVSEPLPLKEEHNLLQHNKVHQRENLRKNHMNVMMIRIMTRQ